MLKHFKSQFLWTSFCHHNLHCKIMQSVIVSLISITGNRGASHPASPRMTRVVTRGQSRWVGLSCSSRNFRLPATHFHLNCASCVCCCFFCIWTFGGFVPHVWVHASFSSLCRDASSVCTVCLCVGWLNVSLVWGSIHHNVIVWGCVCVLSVCMSYVCVSAVTWLSFLLLRVACVCGCRSAKVNTRWKNENKP